MVKYLKYVLLTLLGLFIAFLLAQSPNNKAYAENNPVEYWAVIVGVADYLYLDPRPLFPISGKNYDLMYSDDDAIELDAELRPIWDADHIKLLVDSQATKSRIQNAITDWLDSKEDANDVVLFFFAGHGDQYRNHEYILPYDMLETSVKNHIRDDTLDSWLSCLESSKQIIILDSCRSGGFIDDLSKPGRVVLTSCSKNEDAYEYPSLKHSVFTYYILDAFNHLDDVNDYNDNSISIEEVFNWVEPKVISYTASDPPVQHPQINDGYSGHLSLIDVVNVTFNMSPRISSMTIDGTEWELPLTFTWIEGTNHVITVPPSSDFNGKEYAFDSWNDGDTSLTRTVEASNNTSYNANYNRVGNPIWPYVTGVSVVVVIIFLVIARNKYLSLKRVREIAGAKRIWEEEWEERKRQGARSIHYELTITSEEARIGTTKVLARRGHRLELTIPRGVTNGSVLRLTDALQSTDNSYGDILVTIIIKD